MQVQRKRAEKIQSLLQALQCKLKLKRAVSSMVASRHFFNCSLLAIISSKNRSSPNLSKTTQTLKASDDKCTLCPTVFDTSTIISNFLALKNKSTPDLSSVDKQSEPR